MNAKIRKCPVCVVDETDTDDLDFHIQGNHSAADVAEALEDEDWSTYVSHPASGTAYQEVTVGRTLFARVIVTRVGLVADRSEVVSPSADTDAVYRQYQGRVRNFLADELEIEEGAIRTRPSGYGRIDVFRGDVRKGYVVSHLGAFSAFTAGGTRVKDGDNLMWSLRREAVQAVAGS